MTFEEWWEKEGRSSSHNAEKAFVVLPIQLARLAFEAGVQSTISQDAIIEINRRMLLDRSDVGIKKYGVTIEKSPEELEGWLRHMRFELLDASNYCTAAIEKIHELKELKDEIRSARNIHDLQVDAE